MVANKKTPKTKTIVESRVEQEAYNFFVPSKPIPKGRPRLGRRGRVFTPQTTLDAEAIIASLYEGPLYEGPVKIVVVFSTEGTNISISQCDTEPSKLRGDIDNYLKLLMDGLNGVAWEDDKQVHHVVVHKL